MGNEEQHLLQDLALIYIGLAHGADQDLGAAEMDVIADRLRVWQAGGAQGTILQSIKQALDQYTTPKIDAAVERIGAILSATQRQAVLDDLTEIAMADDKVLYVEIAYIDRLAKAWALHPAALEEDEEHPWSVLIQRPSTGSLRPIHHLVLMYLALAQQTDDHLSHDEVEAITKKLGEWLPGAKEKTRQRILKEALSIYNEGFDNVAFAASIDVVREVVPPHQRAAVMSDLQYVARADGVMLIEERVMIEQLAVAWQLPA